MNSHDLFLVRQLAGSALLRAAREGRTDHRALVADVIDAGAFESVPLDVQRAAESAVKNCIDRELANHIRTHREQ